MPETHSNGVRISHDDHGQGEPALLSMPGWCGGRMVFVQLAVRCAVHGRAPVLDWRGHGQSGTPGSNSAPLIVRHTPKLRLKRLEPRSLREMPAYNRLAGEARHALLASPQVPSSVIQEQSGVRLAIYRSLSSSSHAMHIQWKCGVRLGRKQPAQDSGAPDQG